MAISAVNVLRLSDPHDLHATVRPLSNLLIAGALEEFNDVRVDARTPWTGLQRAEIAPWDYRNSKSETKHPSTPAPPQLLWINSSPGVEKFPSELIEGTDFRTPTCTKTAESFGLQVAAGPRQTTKPCQ